MNSRNTVACLVSLVLGLGLCAACDDGETPAEEDPGEHACERVGETPVDVTASTVRDATAPELHLSGAGYLVALPDGAVGYVRVEIAADTAALAFTAYANVLSELYHGDAAEGVTSSGPNSHCPDEIEDHFHLDFHEAGTYYLELGPTASNEAWLFLVSASGHEHEG